ncbi:hypothetical protein [Lapillicoccus sp.]|uniref:hypothetical protein n=1 Tax=Lapillicoccus sp. TaxID=1909287 RepID=UPI0039834A07
MTDQPGPGEDARPDVPVTTPRATPFLGAVDSALHDHVDNGDVASPTPVAASPRTGDTAIDSATTQLEQSVSSGSLDDQIEAGETLHRTLQGRLSDLGGE